MDTAAAPLQRTTGTGRVGFSGDAVGGSRLAELRQAGALRIRLPRAPTRRPAEAVIVNTAGGLTGGDRFDLAVALEPDAGAVITTAACEKFYRSAGGTAAVSTTVTLATASRLDWLPQPAILFDGADVRRTLAVDMDGDAALTAVEGVILGRTAMGETVVAGSIHDGWRIRRGGRLVFADAFRAGPEIAARLDGGATLRGMRALASFVYVAPDAEARLGQARAFLGACSAETAASAWDGVLVARFAAADGGTLMAALAKFLAAFRAQPLPRSWSC